MEETASMGLQVARLAGSLGLVLIVLFAGVYAMKRWGQWMKKSGTNAWIQVLAQHSFSPKNHLMVVKVQGQSFLVGVSPQGMQLLSVLEEKPMNPPIPENDVK